MLKCFFTLVSIPFRLDDLRNKILKIIFGLCDINFQAEMEVTT
jgi:hypothetical protein